MPIKLVNKSTSNGFYDMDAFLEVAKKFDGNTMLCTLEENRGQGLILLSDDSSIKYLGKLDKKYQDAYVSTGIIAEKFKGRDCKYVVVQGAYKDNAKRTPALFLDRDGIINYDHGYFNDKNDIRLYEDTIELIKFANARNWWVLVITNQSGIARGRFTKEQLIELHNKMGEILKDKGAIVDDWFFSPYHMEGKDIYKKISHLRKPHPGMIIKAMEKYPIDLLKSIMVGDRGTDCLKNMLAINYAIIKRDINNKKLDINCSIYNDCLELIGYLNKKKRN